MKLNYIRFRTRYIINDLEDKTFDKWIDKPVESVVFDHLPEEGDDPLGAVGVHVRQVDLVTEHHQPHAQLHHR